MGMHLEQCMAYSRTVAIVEQSCRTVFYYHYYYYYYYYSVISFTIQITIMSE